MAANSPVGENSQRNYRNQDDIALSLSQALGVEPSGNMSLNSALYNGLQPVVNGMKNGDLTEEQTALIIEVLLANYIEATINVQIERLFQSWADILLADGLGSESGRR